MTVREITMSRAGTVQYGYTTFVVSHVAGHPCWPTEVVSVGLLLIRQHVDGTIAASEQCTSTNLTKSSCCCHIAAFTQISRCVRVHY